MINIVRLAALIALLITTVAGYRPGDEVCVITKDNPCSLNHLTISKTDASTLIYPGGNTRCAFDDFSSRHFKTNSTFFFQVFPKNESQKLLLYFQMGGACVDDRTCNFVTQCSLPKPTFQTNAVAKSTGILNTCNTNNLFHDWNIVHVPYCTGDIHIGNKRIPSKEFHSRFIQGECMGQNMSMHMNGYENTMSALKWALANYPNPQQLVVAGSSAGALGAQYLSDTIANMWKVQEQSIKYSVLADSYVGVVPHSTTTGALINYIGGCDVLPTEIRPKCKDNTATAVEVMGHIIKNTIFSDWLHITSKADIIQRLFAKLVEVTKDPELIISYLDPTTFFKEMNAIIMGEISASTRVSVFFVEGIKHVFLLDDDWYNTKRSETQETFGSFIQTWLSKSNN